MGDTKDVTRSSRGTFVPGVSGNPGGRPKADPRVLETLYTAAPKAALKLIEQMESHDEKISLAAALAILDRVLGKPTQQVSSEGSGGVLLQLIAAFSSRQPSPALVAADDDDDPVDNG